MLNNLTAITNGNQRTVTLTSPYILNQNQYLQEIRMILTHPFFTGECPECKSSMRISARVKGGSRCQSCGWEDSRGMINMDT